MLALGVLLGDGIGPEIVDASTRVAEKALAGVAVEVRWRELPFGLEAIGDFGSPLPEPTLSELDELPGWILGPHDNAGYPEQFRGTLSPGGAIRKRYNLFANIRPARTLSASVRALCPDLDVVIVRENTEGFYADRNMYDGAGEFMPTPDIALAVAVFTRTASERIAHQAFQLAAARRKSVTIAHKTNVLTKTTGLFLDVCLTVSESYPDVEVRGEHIDALAARLVSHPRDFDVIVAENMFGDILSDLAGQLSGSLGMAPSINASHTHAMAQAAHGSAPDIAGRDIANPVAMILSAAMLLRWLAGQEDGTPALGVAADNIEDAVRRVLDAGVGTADIGGSASTSAFTEHVLAALD
ncbi:MULTISPECIES: isocitrate/isopropylmalate dehydrogenase family protein [Mycobacterium]|uniref:3-isopropylmalate dehydrogenase n=1 Tax=Mycobacterium syngnathidarum TaxID=1908205 RepID=A0A1S1K4A3_9MYCO|nr:MULTISPECIES: isocitrate/isopropylmalate dehydrogenase family protein [Mycobacterium]MCG7609047.1 isocitrate/isopropylmalate dehydrogenase family protein [Mycobacterium sp. CnD-18-1]OHT96421.1 3-isopropylmalate dehydrogenase [Mycobacterium syngnathidarum]OLT93280.1 3-isopropylmalate dehydrogenase [Mycobacterium syngnathidarum]